MNPPTRSSIFWPSTVWVLTIVHSCGSSLPGLLMISLGMAILPTSCSSAANSRLRRRSAREVQVLGELESEGDDALAVLAGVAVVGFDHVAEDESGAAVGARELEHALQAAAPLPGEHGQQAEQRHHGQRGHSGVWWMASAASRPGGGQRRVDAVDPDSSRNSEARPASRVIATRSRAGGEVDEELRGERGEQEQRAGILRATCAMASTATGPIENQELLEANSSRLGRILPARDVGGHRHHERARPPRAGRSQAAPRTPAAQRPAGSGR